MVHAQLSGVEARRPPCTQAIVFHHRLKIHLVSILDTVTVVRTRSHHSSHSLVMQQLVSIISVRIVPFTSLLMLSDTASSTTSPMIISKDLQMADLIPARYRSSPSLIPEDESDMEAKAKTLSMRYWNEDEELLAKDKIAEWLGRQ
jgi:hypothetical protein